MTNFKCRFLGQIWGARVPEPSHAAEFRDASEVLAFQSSSEEMEDVFHSSVLCHLTSLLLFMQLPTEGFAQEFTVIAPPDPIVAVLGGEVLLPCRVFPAMSAEDMELRWFRSKFSEAVFIYQDRLEQKEEQMAPYAGRTSLVRDLLNQGHAAVRIQNVNVSDNGLYTCFFRKGGFYEEANLELKVAGVGSAPQVRITRPEEDGVRVVCTASGWFPKPQVQWRDLSGEKFLAFSEAHTQDAGGLFSVEAALVASPWKVAFSVSLTVLVILLLGAGCYTKREHSMKVREKREKETLCQTTEQDRQTKEKVLEDAAKLQEELERRKSAYLAAWRKAQLYADWRKEQFQAWPVTLDPGSAHSGLVVSNEKTSVALKDSCVNSGDTGSVLGFEGIASGRCYWEVEIRDKGQSEWALGVCRESVNRQGWYVESPDKGFWAVGRFERGYCACITSPTLVSLEQVPHPRLRVGVFLDHQERDVSFYNMTDGSHIFSFPQASFSETLFPYFVIKSGDVSFTICSKVGGSEGLPVALSNPLEEAVSLPGKGFSPGSGADGLPGANSPLLPCNPEAVSP
ncbi:butyrophilin subfamily 1 member A1-like isoform X2 [Moschus berezovskii]|uniref:butyrophilin subfamily 1 member A1-like isoform X2 n=1 Tax=Moschus berezovskii TaxID=68408 RepID=UPI002443C9E4|nr:butyrophilin subfamily 1 member A1-like isoform X2 [Moschus berezovskii]